MPRRLPHLRIVALLLTLTLTRPALADPFVVRPGDVVRLWRGVAPMAAGMDRDEVPTLTCFPPAPGTANGTAVVVCPGGGYHILATGHEGTDVARWWSAHGVFAAVLRYRINTPQPAPLFDGQRAVRLLRYHAADWGIDPRRIGILGFSAGGHVAATVGTHYDGGLPRGTGDPIDAVGCRPDFLVLVYAVVSMTDDIAHPGSRRILLGDDPPADLVTFYSAEQQVTAETPPTFLAASRPDPVVPIANSERFADALARHRVPFELIEFPTGRHGYGMAPAHPELNWTDPCLAWLRRRGLLTPWFDFPLVRNGATPTARATR